MAEIFTSKSQETISKPDEVRNFLKHRGIEYRFWDAHAQSKPLLSKDSLNDEQKEELLLSFENRFEELKSEYSYKSRDMIVLNPEIPGLDAMLAKFDKWHYHTDDEVRYIIDGSGIFGFHIQGEKFEVKVSQNDFISVPANTNHWFKLDENKKIKAIRYFQDMSGWTPVYINESDLVTIQ
ncbi:MAG: cupin domain-containing protein [Leptospiraceae bacterium]|jgi:1,2-dihydroxy-3-keto-5-methylthiopentene dioxygenase|nr:cupin domain-containing protein [Leptospiraceae bacterium]MCZ8348160.1 cupin domain-containing protein [Leptospiraceae bacterium]PJE01428.1 MAG: acireductone dioxygenase [Leptospira sp.]